MGYSQGMNYVVATLIRTGMEEEVCKESETMKIHKITLSACVLVAHATNERILFGTHIS